MQNGFWAGVVPAALIALLLMQPHAYGAKASVKSKHRVAVVTGRHVAEKKPVSVQIVSFPETEWQAVKIIRGGTPAKGEAAGVVPAEKAETAEIVTFGDPNSKPVRVVRGDTDRPAETPGRLPRGNETNRELVTFADPRNQPVTVLRGSIAQSLPGIDLFSSAREPDLDRVAFAVDGAESSHGTDLRMWRPEFDGPQGPMQVSAAAAIDIGGGNRFDMAENRQLGRAYLAHMYRRYGNWPDAIAAYNWGPGNMDAWIAAGRPMDSFPLEVERYRDRVLRDAGFDGTPGTRLFYDTRQFPELVSPSVRQYPTVIPSPAPARPAAKTEAAGQLIRP
jgi:Transglycosylase SLT domain